MPDHDIDADGAAAAPARPGGGGGRSHGGDRGRRAIGGVGERSFSGPTDFPVGPAPVSVAVGDFNGDGNPDLAIANADTDSRVGAARRR